MSRLSEIQKWFGAFIAQPLQENHLLPTLSPFGTQTQSEAEKYVSASRTLKPYQRLEIYHQQYWWRLLKCLQTNFPTIVRLFGYAAFQNKLAVPYCVEHPPAHWALCKLGETFPQWLKEKYLEEDKYLVITAAEIDWATEKAFWVKKLPLIDFVKLSPEKMVSQTIFLQPSLSLFSLQGDFFSFRDAFLEQEPEYYNINPFPQMIYGDYHFVLYRTVKNVVKWQQISQAQYWVLSQFKEGNTIEKVCAKLEEMGGQILEEALSQIPFWFKEWTVLEWFGQS